MIYKKQIYLTFLVNQNDIETLRRFSDKTYVTAMQGHMSKSKAEDTTVKKNCFAVI